MREIGSYKCVICGRRKIDIEVRDERPLCPSCGMTQFHNVLESFLEELDEEIGGSLVIDCTSNPFFSFVADLGILGTQHPFLNSFRQVLAELVRQTAGKSDITLGGLHQVASSNHIYRLLFLLRDLNMIELIIDEGERGGVLRSITVPADSLFHKISVTAETDPELNRASTFLFGYVTLRAIHLTLNIIEQTGKLHYGEAITKLYPSDKYDRIMVTKGYTAPVSFIFGGWTRQQDEFTDGDLNMFLSTRGLFGREFRRVLNWFTSAQPGSIHQLFSFETQQDGCVKFRINPIYQQMRERVLVRARERGRGMLT